MRIILSLGFTNNSKQSLIPPSDPGVITKQSLFRLFFLESILYKGSNSGYEVRSACEIFY